MASPVDFADSLQRLVSTHLGDRANVLDVVRLSGGASRETWSVVASTPSGERRLIVQRSRSGGVGSAADMGIEGRVLRLAEAAGVPVAHLYDYSGSPDLLGLPFLLSDRVEGETIARKIQRDDEFGVARTQLAAQLGAAAAKIHSIPSSDVEYLPDTDQLEQYRLVLDTLGEPHPAFELGFKWLTANRLERTRTTLVHGDFRLGNVIVNATGLAAVIDWELAHRGDPMEDLGWVCVRAWRFGGKSPVAGIGDYSELFDAYGEASGIAVDPAVVRWWEVLGTLKWGIICIMQASSHLTGLNRSVELAAIGRRVCENEYDLLALLP